MKQKRSSQNSALVAAALWVGCIAPLLCIAIFTLDGSTREGYDQMHHWISHLSLGPRGWLGTFNLVMIGISLLFFSVAVKRAMLTGKGSTWAPRLVGLAGIGFLVASAFKQDPGLGYPPGVAASTGSAADSIHGAAALLLFSSLVALCFVLARRFTGCMHTYALVAAWTTIVTFVACSVLVSLDYAKVWVGAPSGLLERIALISVLVYVSMFAYRLIHKKV